MYVSVSSCSLHSAWLLFTAACVGLSLLSISREYDRLVYGGRYFRSIYRTKYREVNYPHSKFAICAIAKDEDEYLTEWVEHHAKLGASRIYLFDNNSTRPQNLFLMDYIRSGFVEYFTIGGYKEPNAQLHAYERCLHEYRDQHDYIAFIDVDEFIVINNSARSVPDILDDYSDCGGLALNWMIFGSAGQIQQPKGRVLETFHQCYKHPLVKLIVNTQRAIGIKSNPHSFQYVYGSHACDTSHNRVDGPTNTNLARAFDVMYINHYRFKGEEHYKMKMERGYTIGDTAQIKFETYDLDNKNAIDYCPSPL